jgi:hypothetical protein
MASTADWLISTEIKRSVMTTEELFLQWWKESFPNAKPAPHAVMTHVAFADYAAACQTQTLLEQVRGITGGQTS